MFRKTMMALLIIGALVGPQLATAQSQRTVRPAANLSCANTGLFVVPVRARSNPTAQSISIPIGSKLDVQLDSFIWCPYPDTDRWLTAAERKKYAPGRWTLTVRDPNGMPLKNRRFKFRRARGGYVARTRPLTQRGVYELCPARLTALDTDRIAPLNTADYKYECLKVGVGVGVPIIPPTTTTTTITPTTTSTTTTTRPDDGTAGTDNCTGSPARLFDPLGPGPHRTGDFLNFVPQSDPFGRDNEADDNRDPGNGRDDFGDGPLRLWPILPTSPGGLECPATLVCIEAPQEHVGRARFDICAGDNVSFCNEGNRFATAVWDSSVPGSKCFAIPTFANNAGLNPLGKGTITSRCGPVVGESIVVRFLATGTCPDLD